MYDYARTRLYYASTHNNVYIRIRVPTLSRTIVFFVVVVVVVFRFEGSFLEAGSAVLFHTTAIN